MGMVLHVADVKRKLNEGRKRLSATVAQDVSRRCWKDQIYQTSNFRERFGRNLVFSVFP